MPADGVKSKGGVVFVYFNDFAIRNKAKLYKSLEAVANAEHKAVSAIEQLVNRLFNLGISECCGNKFARTLRLVTAGKAAGQHNDLAFVDKGNHFVYCFVD